MTQRGGGFPLTGTATHLLLMTLLFSSSGPAAAASIAEPRMVRVRAEACRPQTSPEGLRLVVLGHYEGAALSTVWLGDPGEEVEVTDIRILPGDPIHLVITAYKRVIYRFSGDTDRVRRLTLMNDRAAGAVGVSAQRMDFARSCIDHHFFHNARSEALKPAIEKHFGRPADIVGGAYSLWRVDIGAELRVNPAPEVRAPMDLESEELFRFSPGGIVRIDPGAVTSSVPAGRYAVLPQEAGVRQLVASGALIRAIKADSEQWRSRAAARGLADRQSAYGLRYGTYRVSRPIRIPAGLCGAHSISLYAHSPA